MNKTVAMIIGAICLGAFVFGIVMLMKQSTPAPAPAASANAAGSALTITLTKDGFIPAESTIKAGDTVTFVTDSGKPFWPASNLHPSHLLYPEFDPKQPVAANASWSFTFTKVGSWKFHDHLAPYFTGTITVTD